MIPVAKPDMRPEDAQCVAKTILSGWILQGPNVEEFEKLLAGYVKTPYAVATSSCTTSMHLGYIAAGIRPGDEVIVPSLSFIASANSIIHAGAIPVFADVDERMYNIDPKDAEQKITKKTKAILAVHQIGLPADMETLTRITRKYSLLLFEDCACALGARIGNRHVGTYGVWGAFSFHPRKAITTAEGGMLVTKDKGIARTVRMLRQHGASVSVRTRHKSRRVMEEEYPTIGYNFRMSDIHAALGISQFGRINQYLTRRRFLAQRYNESLKDHPRISIPYIPKGSTHTFQSYMIRIPGGSRIRKRLMQKLLDSGIATRAGVMASHLEKPYRRMYPNLTLAVTEKVAKETIILPLYPQMSECDQDYIIDRLKKALTRLL